MRAARRRPSFVLRAGCHVDRVLLDGLRATGVRYVDPDGRPVDVAADLVVLSAGVYSTPPILQRSGIGPAGDLRAAGIEPVHDLPVGTEPPRPPELRARLPRAGPRRARRPALPDELPRSDRHGRGAGVAGIPDTARRGRRHRRDRRLPQPPGGRGLRARPQRRPVRARLASTTATTRSRRTSSGSSTASSSSARCSRAPRSAVTALAS